MNYYGSNNSAFKPKVLIIVLLAFALLLVFELMNYPDIIERWYSNGLYLFISKSFHPVLNLLPFSFGDLVYIALIIYILYAFGILIFYLIKRKFNDLLLYALKLIIGSQVIILTFYLFWGLNYFRTPAAKRLNLQDSSYTFNDIKVVTLMLIDSANVSRARLTRADLTQSDDTIFMTAASAVKSISSIPDYPAYHPAIKPSFLTFFLNYLGTAGYFNPFTSEAQMNYQMPVFLKPFTACHEMAHQMGFGAEDEADFGGFVSGIASHDRLLSYSTYYSGVGQFMSAVFRTDSVVFKELKTKISPQVRSDFRTDRRYWKGFEGRAGILSSILYDRYLKSNNQPQGLKTYNQMIKLVTAWYLKKAKARSLK
jgi:hypothetical protein